MIWQYVYGTCHIEGCNLTKRDCNECRLVGCPVHGGCRHMRDPLLQDRRALADKILDWLKEWGLRV